MYIRQKLPIRPKLRENTGQAVQLTVQHLLATVGAPIDPATGLLHYSLCDAEPAGYCVQEFGKTLQDGPGKNPRRDLLGRPGHEGQG
jgi:hypothetical protein